MNTPSERDQRDAARYRWLRENAWAMPLAEQFKCDVPLILAIKRPNEEFNNGRPWPEIDAAIDAAMAGSGASPAGSDGPKVSPDGGQHGRD